MPRRCIWATIPRHCSRTADVVLVLDTLVPWLPKRHVLSDQVKVIQTGPDPISHANSGPQLPERHFARGRFSHSLAALEAAMAPTTPAVRERFVRLSETSSRRREEALARAATGAVSPMRSDWVSLCLSEGAGA